MTKSVRLTYLLWLIGGWLGLHHLYLRRDRQFFVWVTTFGGFFGVGWLRDLWKIPLYVDDCNGEKKFEERLAMKMQSTNQPSIGSFKSSGMFFFAYWMAIVFRASIPNEFLDKTPMLIADIFLPPIVATGVWFVGAIGREKVKFWWCLFGAYIPLYWTLQNVNHISTSALLSSSLACWKGTEWKRSRPKRRGCCRRFSMISFGLLLYFGMFTTLLLFNTHVTTKDGEQVPLRVAMRNFFTSPAWQQTKKTLSGVWEFYKVNGIWRVWEEILVSLDPKGEGNAYKVLGLSESASQEEITARYRKLARQWHPDKYKDPVQKEEAQQKFMEISESYQILSQVKNRRSRMNAHSREERDEEKIEL